MGFLETFKSIYSAISVVGTVGTGLLCPPCAPAVGGIFAVGGAVINGIADNQAKEAKMAHEEMVKNGLNRTIYALSDINGTLYDMKGTLRDMNGVLIDTNSLLHDMNGTLYFMNGTLLNISQIVQNNNELLHDLKEMVIATAEENKKNAEGP